jgi:hypothetical protein
MALRRWHGTPVFFGSRAKGPGPATTGVASPSRTRPTLLAVQPPPRDERALGKEKRRQKSAERLSGQPDKLPARGRMATNDAERASKRKLS